MTSKRKSPITLRPSGDRGFADHGWLKTYHTFSFADYYDERYMGFRSLRVINEDWVAPAEGFDPHPHRNMEIMTYVIEGALEHKDSMGHGSVIRPGEIQKMSAGSGIIHSEFNASKDETTHLLQVWITPRTADVKPSYEQFALPRPIATQPLLLIGSSKTQPGVARFYQDIRIYRGIMVSGAKLEYALLTGRGLWVQLIKGRMTIDNILLTSGDGAAVEDLRGVRFQAEQVSEFLLFDMN